LSSGNSPTISSTQRAAWQRAGVEGQAVTAAARALAPYLVRRPDGTLSLDAPAAVVDRLPSKYVGELSAGLRTLNAKVMAGELQTTAAGAVFDPRTDSLTLQGGWSGYGQNWWHSYICLSHYDVGRMTNFGWWAMSAAGIAAIGAFSSVFGAAIGIVVSLFGGWMYLADKGNGSCLNMGHWPPPNMWVTSQ
jgi:hypothetical protein